MLESEEAVVNRWAARACAPPGASQPTFSRGWAVAAERVTVLVSRRTFVAAASRVWRAARRKRSERGPRRDSVSARRNRERRSCAFRGRGSPLQLPTNHRAPPSKACPRPPRSC